MDDWDLEERLSSRVYSQSPPAAPDDSPTSPTTPQKAVYVRSEYREFFNPRLVSLPIVQSTITLPYIGWDLPGKAKRPTNDWCGSFYTDPNHTFPGCLNHEKHPDRMDHVFIKHPHTCFKKDCPLCYLRWVDRETVKINARIDYLLGRAESKKIAHYVISVPKKLYSRKYENLKKMAIKWGMEAGIEGGVLIFHPFRQNDDVFRRGKNGRSYLVKKADPSMPKGAWYFSPHFHVVGYGWLPDGSTSRVFSESHGWIVKKQPERVTVGGTIWYQLTHCGIHKKYRAVNWFGICALTTGTRVPKPERVAEKCPHCGDPVAKVYVKPTLDYYDKKVHFRVGDNSIVPGLLKYKEGLGHRFAEYKEHWNEDPEVYS